MSKRQRADYRNVPGTCHFSIRRNYVVYQLGVALANSQMVPGTKGGREAPPPCRSPTSFLSRAWGWEGFGKGLGMRD